MTQVTDDREAIRAGSAARPCDRMGACVRCSPPRAPTCPTGTEWLHEVKWDGMRVLVDVGADGELHIRSRNEKDVTRLLPRAARPRRPRPRRAARRRGGRVPRRHPDVRRAGRPHARRAGPPGRRCSPSPIPVTLLVFDLLRLDGEDLTGRPLTERRELLEGLGLLDVHWQVPATYDDGPMLLEATAAQRLEGIVSKKRSSTYRPGRRSADWLKFPHRAHRVVRRRGLAPRDRQRHPDRGGAGGGAHRGRPGLPGPGGQSGIAGKEGQRLLGVLEPLLADASPFADDVPKVDAARHRLGAARGRGRHRRARDDPGQAAAAAGLPRHPQGPEPRRPGALRWLRRRTPRR